MPSLFEPTTAGVVISRLQQIKSDTPRQWGKMNAAQMMAHCNAGFEFFFSGRKMKRNLFGILFGKRARKDLASEKPWPKNLPTLKEVIITDERELAVEKAKLVYWIERFCTEGHTVTGTVHPFFGNLTTQEWGFWAYKHMNHHLHQFGV